MRSSAEVAVVVANETIYDELWPAASPARSTGHRTFADLRNELRMTNNLLTTSGVEVYQNPFGTFIVDDQRANVDEFDKKVEHLWQLFGKVPNLVSEVMRA